MDTATVLEALPDAAVLLDAEGVVRCVNTAAGRLFGKTRRDLEGMDEGTLIMSGTQPAVVVDAVKVATERYARAGRTWGMAADYDVDDVASKVVNIIFSYTGYVNRTVWRR